MSNLGFKSKDKIDSLVESLSFSKVNRFYPLFISNSVELPLEETFDYLLTLTEDGRLNLLWEVRCPNYHCHKQVLLTEDIDKYMNTTLECNDCENEIEVTPNLVFPVFQINHDYREYVRSQGKKKPKNLLKAL